MRVLLCHVHYRQAGGEDAVFATEREVLLNAGVEVETLEFSSARLAEIPAADRVRIALQYADHDFGRRAVRDAAAAFEPDVVHFHNLYPHLGPGAIRQADTLGLPTVQTIHNYRLSCLAGTHLRDFAPCQSCRPGHYGWGVVHRCYRRSWTQSVLARQATGRQWAEFVRSEVPTLWLSLTDYMRDHWVRYGAPAERVVTKTNSVAAGSPSSAARTGVFCGGRLSPEKGVLQLMERWPADAPRLTVAGAGPMEPQVRAVSRPNVSFVGRLERPAMREALRSARIVVMPSIWPEPLGLVAVEAYSEGTPVVAFKGTSLGSVVRRVSERCLVDYPDFDGLARRAGELAVDPVWDDLSRRCLDLWREDHAHEVNERRLLRVYERAIALRRRRPGAR